MAGGGGFLDHGRILLRDLVHLVHGDIDLLQATGLFLRRGDDLAGDGGDALDLTADALQRLAGVADQLHALANLTAGGRDQGLDLLGRFRRTLGQGPDFRGHDRETATGVAGARRLDARVQRQEVGLEGDLVDHADDVADLVGRTLDLAHRHDGAAHDGLTVDRLAAGGLDHAPRLDGVLGRARHRGGNLLQGGGGFFQGGGLLLGAARQVVGGLRNLMGAGADGAGAVDDDAHGALQLGHCPIEVGAQLFILGREASVQAEGQLTVRQTIKARGDAVHDLSLLTRHLGVALRLGDAGLFGDGALDLGLGFQAHLLLGILFEGQDGGGHVTDLVTATDGRNGDVQIAGRQAAHGARHGLHRAAQRPDQPGDGAERDHQGHHPADGEAPVGLLVGEGLGLGVGGGDHRLFFLNGADGGADVRQAGAGFQTGHGLRLGGGVARQGDQTVGAVMEGVDRAFQRRLFLSIGGVDVSRSQIGQARDQHLTRLFVFGNEVSVPRRHEGAHGVLLLDRRGQHQVRGLEHLGRGGVGGVSLLQHSHGPQDHQGRHPAGRDHGGEGQHQLLGNGQVLQHFLRSGED
ncbi:hypothetical protein D3C80_919660 [compost metagenome]